MLYPCQATNSVLRTCNDPECCLVDVVSDVIHAKVPQHHHATEQQGGGVGQVLASDVGGCAVNSLHQRQTVEACSSRHEHMRTIKGNRMSRVWVLRLCTTV